MAAQIGQELASAPFDEMIRNLLLAMVAAQNEANTSFIEGVAELADTVVEIKYKKDSEERTISGNAIAFGILPTLLQIQQGIIEIKMAITMERTRRVEVGVKAKMSFMCFSASVDAKYSSTYSYKVEASSLVRIQVAPAPPPAPLMKAIDKIAQDTPPTMPA
jgi:hypothetical protein